MGIGNVRSTNIEWCFVCSSNGKKANVAGTI